MTKTTVAKQERRGSKAAVVPLGLIALVFVLPSVSGGSPAQYAFSDLGLAGPIVPVFLFAGLFTALTAVALRRGQVDRLMRQLGLASLAALCLITVGYALSETGAPWPWLAITLAAAAGAAALVRRARGLGPWQIWEHQLAAYAVLAAGTWPSFFVGTSVLQGSFNTFGPGAYLYIAALLALWVVVGIAVARSRRPR